MGLRQILGIRKGGESKPKPSTRPKSPTPAALGGTARKPDLQPQPTSTRVTFSIPVRISGRNQSGQSFSEQTHTLWVDQSRIRVVTFEQPVLGAELVIESAELGRSDLVKVAWKGERASPEQPLELDLELIEIFESDGTWGTAYPSPSVRAVDPVSADGVGTPPRSHPDGTDGAAVTPVPERGAPGIEEPGTSGESATVLPAPPEFGQAHDSGGNGHPPMASLPMTARAGTNLATAAVIEPVARTEEDLQPPVVSDLDNTAGASAGLDHPASPPLDSPGASELAEAGLPTLDVARVEAGVTEPVKDRAVQVTPGFSKQVQDQTEGVFHRLGHAVDQLTSQAEARFHELRRESEDRLTSLAQLHEQQAAQSSVAAALDLQRQAEELGQRMRNEVEKALQNAGREGTQRATDELRQLATDLENRVSNQIESQAATTAKQLTERLEASSAAVRNLERESKALLERVRDEIGQALHSAEQQGFSAASKVLRELAQSLETRVSTQLEHQADATVKRLTERLEASAAVAASDLEQHSCELLERVRAQVETALSGAERGAEAASKDLRRLAQDLQDGVSQQVRSQAGTVLVELTERLQASAATLAAETRKQIESIVPPWQDTAVAKTADLEETEKRLESARQQAETLANSLRQAAEEAGAELHLAKGALEEQLQVYETQLRELSSDRIATIEHEAGGLAERLRQGFDETLAEARKQGTSQSLEELNRRAADLKHELAQEATERSREALQGLTEQIQTVAARLVQEAEEQTAEKLQSGVNAAVVAEVEAARERVAQLARESIEPLAERAFSEFEQRLAPAIQREVGAARERADEAVRAIESVLHQASGEVESGRANLEELEKRTSFATERLQAAEEAQARAFDERSRQIAGEVRDQVDEALAALEQRRAEVHGGLENSLAGLVEAASIQLRSQVEAQSQVFEKQLGQLTSTGIEALHQEASALSDRLRDNLDKALAGFGGQRAGGTAEDLGQQADELKQRMAQEIEATGRLAAQKLDAQIQTSTTAWLENAQEQLEALARHVLHAATEEAATRLSCEAKAAIAEATEKAREQLETEKSAIHKLTDRWAEQLDAKGRDVAQQLGIQLEDTASRLLENGRQRLDEIERQSIAALAGEALKEFQGHVGQAVEGRLESAQARAEAMVRTVESVASETSERAKSTGAEVEKQANMQTVRLQAMASQQAELLERRSQEIGRDVCAQMDKALAGLKHSGVAFREEMEKTARTLVEQASKQLRALTEETVKNLGGQSQTSVGTGVEDTRKQLLELIREHTGNLKQELESRLEAHRAEVQELEKELRPRQGDRRPESPARGEVKGFEKQVKDVVREQLDWLRREFDAPGRGLVSFPTRLVALLMLLAMAPAVICLYLYLRPAMRLQTDPPADFFDSRPAWGVKRFSDGKQEDLWLQTDRVLARAYWDWAAKHLEKKYPFGSRLPENPPIDLQVEGPGFPVGLDAEFAKVHYWQKLQKAWAQPQSWEKVSLPDAFP